MSPVIVQLLCVLSNFANVNIKKEQYMLINRIVLFILNFQRNSNTHSQLITHEKGKENSFNQVVIYLLLKSLKQDPQIKHVNRSH